MTTTTVDVLLKMPIELYRLMMAHPTRDELGARVVAGIAAEIREEIARAKPGGTPRYTYVRNAARGRYEGTAFYDIEDTWAPASDRIMASGVEIGVARLVTDALNDRRLP